MYKSAQKSEGVDVVAYILICAQGITILLWGLFCEFGEYADPLMDPSKNDAAKDYVQNKYAPYQDVHVMIFIGFGFLMTFIKTGSLQALAYNWIISVWCI
jgi:ammonium transporter Rh